MSLNKQTLSTLKGHGPVCIRLHRKASEG